MRSEVCLPKRRMEMRERLSMCVCDARKTKRERAVTVAGHAAPRYLPAMKRRIRSIGLRFGFVGDACSLVGGSIVEAA